MKSIHAVKSVEWKSIKQIQEMKFVQSMYVWLFLVPVMVRLFKGLEEVTPITVFEHKFELHTTLPFSITLFYACALCFVISSVLYHLRCPLLIKENSSWRDFAEQGKSNDHLQKYADRLDLSSSEADQAWLTVVQDQPLPPGGSLQVKFWQLYKLAEEKNVYAKTLSLTLLVFAFIGISIVIGQNLCEVFKYALNH